MPIVFKRFQAQNIFDKLQAGVQPSLVHWWAEFTENKTQPDSRASSIFSVLAKQFDIEK